MHVFMLAHLLIQTDHLLYIPSCTNWVLQYYIIFLTMHALRGAYQATLLAFITKRLWLLIMGFDTSKLM